MLQVIFGDDEHTAVDGSYGRLLKTRKWLYITAISLIVVGTGLYDESAAKSFMQIISLPAKGLKFSLIVGLIYLLLQYSLLSIQLYSTYDIVLYERFSSRRAEELSNARENWVRAQGQLGEAESSFHANREKYVDEYLAGVEKELTALKIELASAQSVWKNFPPNQRETSEGALARHAIYRARAKIAERNQLLKDASQGSDGILGRISPESDKAVLSLRREVVLAEEALEDLRRREPSGRLLYRASERAIDFFRILPPFALSAYAFYSLL